MKICYLPISLSGGISPLSLRHFGLIG